MSKRRRADGEEEESADQHVQNKAPCKSLRKRKDDSEANSDRLTELPECLLSKILSLLPIEEAARTGVLCTRWKNLWKYVDKIVIDRYVKAREPTERKEAMITLQHFVSSVDGTLMQCVCPKTLYLCCTNLMIWVGPNTFNFAKESPDLPFLCDMFHKWLQKVYCSLKVESLTVDIIRFSYAPPEWFFNNSTLVKLDIMSWDFSNLGPVVSWNSLKSLSLHHVFLDDEQIAKILSGCPLLEELVLDGLKPICKTMNIMSPRLVKLSVGTFYWNMTQVLWEINAPWLRSLSLSGTFFHVVVQLINVSSLVHANLDFYLAEDLRLDATFKVLHKVHHVQELTIGRPSILALSMLKLSGTRMPLFKCKRLTFVVPIFKYQLPVITYVLQNSHHLETLVIKFRRYDTFLYPEEENVRCDFDALVYLSTEIGDFPHLKSIEVVYCESVDVWEECSEYPDSTEIELFIYELVANIMRKAPLLEKLVIEPREDGCRCNCSRNYEDASILYNKFLQLSVDRGEEEVAEWEFSKKKNYFEIAFCR